MFKNVLEILEPYDAGAFPNQIEKEYGIPKERIINLGSNESPYPPPKSVIEEIIKEASNVNRYPNPSYRELKEKLSEYTNLPGDNISIGSGTSEILDTICKISLNPFDKVVIPLPTYTMYVFLSMLRDTSLEFVETEEPEFEVKAEDVINSAKDAKAIFLCSPNNPTGKTIEKKELIKITEETNALVVVDEAYCEFSGKTIADKIEDYDNLIVVRSMSKFFGLAGLRLGYALSSTEIVQWIEKARLPFNLSDIAQKAAIKAIEEREWFEKVRAEIIAEREFVGQEINKIRGFKALSSEANFLLVKLPSKLDAPSFIEDLYKKGIIVRDVTGVPGLKGSYIRITIGKKEENRRLISVLGEMGFE